MTYDVTNKRINDMLYPETTLKSKAHRKMNYVSVSSLVDGLKRWVSG